MFNFKFTFKQKFLAKKLFREFLGSPTQKKPTLKPCQISQQVLPIISQEQCAEVFQFWLRINDETIKTTGFCDNAHSYICSICLRLDIFSLTEIQNLQINPSEKETHTNESIMPKGKFNADLKDLLYVGFIN